MNFDEYFDKLQKAWQCQHANAKLPINADADVLLKEVRRNQQRWEAINFWDAVVEIGGGFLGTLFFSYLGVRHANWAPLRLPDWDFLLVAFACAGLGIFRTFMLVDRIVQRRKQTTANDPLKACIEASLNEVNHQVWLLRNVFWWCLLPIGTALAVSRIYASLRAQNPLWAVMGLLVFPLLYWGLYRLNQFVVRKGLEPRRQELQTLLTSLE